MNFSTRLFAVVGTRYVKGQGGMGDDQDSLFIAPSTTVIEMKRSDNLLIPVQPMTRLSPMTSNAKGSIDIAALREGDEQAFRELVEHYQDRVYNTCRGFLGTAQEAEDAAQEVFVEVFNSIDDFRQEAQLSTWIHRIAVTKSLEAIRRSRRKKRFAIVVGGHGEDHDTAYSPDQARDHHPLVQLENTERAAALHAALNRLPDSQRVAFTLSKIDGLSYEEIGEVMETSRSSVESLIHRAKLNLRKYLYTFYLEQQS